MVTFLPIDRNPGRPNLAGRPYELVSTGRARLARTEQRRGGVLTLQEGSPEFACQASHRVDGPDDAVETVLMV